MESATVNAADQNSGQLSSSANVSDLGAAREALHTNFDPSIICEALSPSKFEEIHFPDTSPKAIINQILSILKKLQVVYTVISQIRFYTSVKQKSQASRWSHFIG